MRKVLLVSVLMALGTASPAFGQATRTWVSGTGDDANPCSRTAPCKTWAGAISKTATGGEIDALDPGGYGTLTITKALTVSGIGTHASTLAAGGIDGIIVNAPGARVHLRDLVIQGVGTGRSAIRIDNAGAVVAEDIDITGFTRHGVDATPTSGATSLTLDRVRVADVGGNAVHAEAPAADAPLKLFVRDSRLTDARGTYAADGPSGIGVRAGSGVQVWLSGTTIFDNLVGTRAVSTFGDPGVLRGYCDNQIGGNSEDGMEPTRLCPDPPPKTTETNTTTVVREPAPPPVTVQAAPTCLVPELVGLSLSAARRGLKASGCATGKVTRRRAPRGFGGRVRSQAVRGGQRRPAGTKVAVTAGR